jgi:hypothetical protein
VSISDYPYTPASPARTGRAYAGLRTALKRCFRWLIRPRRVLLLLTAVWIVNIFDLGYTLLESIRRDFIEVNPLAAKLVGASPEALVVYKAALVVVSSAILLAHRRQRIAELACWFLFAIHLYVGICWARYYEDMLETLIDPAVNSDPLIGICPL